MVTLADALGEQCRRQLAGAQVEIDITQRLAIGD
jgi:hypothetical protein